MTHPRFYVDCDGVLADFDLKFKQLFDLEPQKFEKKYGAKAFWDNIKCVPGGFFKQLPLMPDANELMNELQKFTRPIILTGCPYGGWSEIQKIRWAENHFPGIPMITCMSRDKNKYCEDGDVLIDDRTTYMKEWNDAGGIYIVHTSTSNTLQELKNHRLHD